MLSSLDFTHNENYLFVHYYKSLVVGDILFSGNQNTY